MGERSAGNLHAAFDAEGAGNVARSKRFGLNRRASPRPYLGAPGGAIPPGDSTRAAVARCGERVSLALESRPTASSINHLFSAATGYVHRSNTALCAANSHLSAVVDAPSI